MKTYNKTQNLKNRLKLAVIILLILLPVFLTIECSKKNDSIESKIETVSKAELQKKLKSPESYKPGAFRVVTYLNGDYYLGAKDTIGARYEAHHIYLSKNSFNAEIQDMAYFAYDDKMNLITLGKWSDRDERRIIKVFKEKNVDIKPLEWVAESN